MAMRVLITMRRWNDLTGAELYVKDLALELQRQGHFTAVYTSSMGRIAEELQSCGIPVTDSLHSLDFQPDVIHGHHRYETLLALQRFRSTPGIFVCHHHDYWVDDAPLHSRILRFCGVSRLCLETLLRSGAPSDRVLQVYNFVDMQRFKRRSHLPAKARRALVFSNYASEDTFLPAVEEACRQTGLELTVLGTGVGRPAVRPEDLLAEYDIIFAKAKAAMEGIAVGAAVILCDFGGVGPMVTTEKIPDLRKLNFGFEALTAPHTVEVISSRIREYDAEEATKASDLFRSTAGLDAAARDTVQIYKEVVEEYERSGIRTSGVSDVKCIASMPIYRMGYGLSAAWKSIPQSRRTMMSSSKLFKAVRNGFRRIARGVS